MLRVVQDSLSRRHEGSVPLVVPTGVQVPVVLGEQRRRYGHPQAMSRWQYDAGEPEVHVVSIDSAGLEQRGLVEAIAESCSGGGLLDALRRSVGVNVQQHDEPVGVHRVGGSPECGRHRAGDLHLILQRIRGEDQHVGSGGVNVRVVFVQAQLQFPGVH